MCGIEENKATPPIEIEYNPALAGTALQYDNAFIFKNSRNAECPISSCELLKKDCVTALASPMKDYISITGNPWALKIDKITQPGYIFDDVCYKCTNGE